MTLVNVNGVNGINGVWPTFHFVILPFSDFMIIVVSHYNHRTVDGRYFCTMLAILFIWQTSTIELEYARSTEALPCINFNILTIDLYT